MEQTRRNSRKRTAIYNALCAAKDHPTAEMLFQRLKPEYPDLSLGTVYRNLTMFREDGLAVVPCTVDGHDRFDGCTAPHPHFVCTCCRSVTDLPEDMRLDRTVRELCEENGCEPKSYAVTIHGICSHCRAEFN